MLGLNIGNEPEQPLVGYHFKVDFIFANPYVNINTRFQKVDGIGKSIHFRESTEGENTVKMRAPEGLELGKLRLTRGLYNDDFLLSWFQMSIIANRRIPIPIVVSALNEKHMPQQSWIFYNTYPTSWETGGFDAKESKLIIETIELEYNGYVQINSGMTGLSGFTPGDILSSLI